VKFGIVTFPVHPGIPPAVLGRAVEDLGFESLFFTEHTHIPASRESPLPGGGGDLSPAYYHNLDPFVAFASVAEHTSGLLLGTGVCILVQRDPIMLAKQIATLDQLSDGRFLFGVGAGWNLEEMRNHGTDPATRFRLLHQRIEAMRTIWTQDEASYHGSLVSFDPIWSWPKPVRASGPPILVGGNGRRVIDRVVAYGDEWFPLATSTARLTAQAEELRGKAAAAGRAPIPITLFGGLLDPESIETYERLGVHRLLVSVRSGSTEEVVGRVKAAAEQLREYGLGR
jgi:probable F420-dependent oxidoreductase